MLIYKKTRKKKSLPLHI